MTSGTPSQPSTRPATRATILLGVRDHAHHTSLRVKLMQRAKRAKLAGATVFAAHEGYGVSRRIHQNHALSGDSPLALVIIDAPERINAFLLENADLLADVVIVMDDVDIVEF